MRLPTWKIIPNPSLKLTSYQFLLNGIKIENAVFAVYPVASIDIWGLSFMLILFGVYQIY